MSGGAARLSLDAVNGLSRDAFVAAFGAVFERAPWVAEAAWDARPFASLDDLHAAMVEAVEKAGRDRQLALIRAHPELGLAAAGEEGLSAFSRAEQAAAGLAAAPDGARVRLQALNARYRERFGFAFVMAVRGQSPERILAAAEARLENAPEDEIARALAEIAKIAAFRLADLVAAE